MFHFNRPAFARVNHIRWAVGGSTGHVLTGGDQADEMHWQFHLRDCLERPDDCGRAAHIGAHIFHSIGALDADTARIKRESFAHEHKRRGV